MEKKPGVVKYIVSPNCVLVAGPVNKETGVPHTKYLTLQGVQAPEYSLQDKDNPRQESFGFQAREFLRTHLLGQQIEFTTEHKIKDSNEKIIGRVFKNGQDIGELQIKEGLAQVRGKPTQPYEEAQSLAKDKMKGIWSQKENQIKFNKIDPKELKVGSKYQNCLVEDVAGLFVFYVYVQELNGLVKCSFGEIFMPQASTILQNKAKWTLQELILQQQVQIQILGFDEKFQSARVDIFKGQVDIKRELISLGYFKLAPNAFQIVSDQKRYNMLRETQQQAEIKLVGIWKDAFKNTQQQVQQGNKSTFQGKVVEVHSGDCLSVLNLNSREIVRLFLASIKSPKYGKVIEPWGFESREFVRRHAIGKLATVEVEYSKKIKQEVEDQQKEITMIFANVLFNDGTKDQNLAALVVGAGLASAQPPRGEDGFSRYMEELTAAQEAASKAKKGIHGKAVVAQKIIDLSVNPSIQRSKDSFDSLKTSKRLSGVVELVLNGSRMKIRFNESHLASIVLLAGVRCLPNEQNMPEFAKYSNIALQYAKENVLQRDVEVELESCDKKGVFHGHVFLGKNKTNLGLQLLEMGLAISFNPVQNAHAYQALFIDAEQKAKLQGEGLWSIKNLDLSLVKGDFDFGQQAQFKQLNGELKKWVLVDIADCNQLYFQDPSDKLLLQIEKTLSQFSATEQNKLVAPLKKGLLCVAKFSEDGRWYRARVTRDLKNKYDVLFLDYGNTDRVSLNDIRKMPENLATLKYQAISSSLAYLTCPSFNHQLSDKVGNFIREQIFEKEVVVQLEYEIDQTVGIIVYLTKDNHPLKSLNYLLLQQGFAKLNGKTLPDKFKDDWTKADQEAETAVKGIWQYADDEDDE